MARGNPRRRPCRRVGGVPLPSPVGDPLGHSAVLSPAFSGVTLTVALTVKTLIFWAFKG